MWWRQRAEHAFAASVESCSVTVAEPYSHTKPDADANADTYTASSTATAAASSSTAASAASTAASTAV